ncbi:hypothetical protein CM15mP35_01050 [bacterium]|nr:MAG: hypothetical protein CM15mP35_01050 [bacterium]
MCNDYVQLFEELCDKQIEITESKSLDDLEVSNIYIYKLNKFVKKIISKVKL